MSLTQINKYVIPIHLLRHPLNEHLPPSITLASYRKQFSGDNEHVFIRQGDLV